MIVIVSIQTNRKISGFLFPFADLGYQIFSSLWRVVLAETVYDWASKSCTGIVFTLEGCWSLVVWKLFRRKFWWILMEVLLICHQLLDLKRLAFEHSQKLLVLCFEIIHLVADQFLLSFDDLLENFNLILLTLLPGLLDLFLF